MKKLFVILFVSPLFSKGQSGDLIYLPNSKNLIASYSFNHTPIGMYVGGSVRTLYPTPFFYPTPLSYMNRLGISISNRKMDFMFGGYIENYRDSIKINPDFWFKIYLLKNITNTTNGFDIILALNYMKKTNVGIGVSIPFGGIYYR